MRHKIGFIGLGEMGKWMAVNMTEKGFSVTVHDIDPRAMDFLREYGVEIAPTPAELARRSDWVFLSLPDIHIVRQVVWGDRGVAEGMKPGLILIDLGTTSYLDTLKLAEELGDRGIDFADAPVSGMKARAQKAELTIMFGGRVEAFETVKPALEAIGNLVLYVGRTGSGQLVKLVNQLLFNINVAAVAEILPMAAKLGLDPEKVVQVATSGTGRSFAVEFFAPRILEGKFQEGYALKNAYKDMVSAAEICAHYRIPLPLTHAATTTYQMALAEGYGDEAKGAMIKVFERILGVEFRKYRENAL